jgi:murein DD-endopeptidase MepM/ murein hydrolase activator NlpD
MGRLGTSTRGKRMHVRVVAASVVLGSLGVGVAAASPAVAESERVAATVPTLRSTDYPSWADVQAAQHAESAAKTLIARIRAQLAQLKAASAAAQKDAKVKGDAFAKAQEAYDAQDFKTQQLQAQADAAKKDADAARLKAGRLAAQLSRTSGGIGTTATLLSNQGSGGQELYRFQAYDQLMKQSQGIYARAIQAKKSAQSLTDQAKVQKKILNDLEATAQAAFAAAQDAATKAQAAVDAETEHAKLLQAQLTVLTQKRAATRKDYEAGLVAQWGPGAAGRVSPSGWADPSNGVLLDGFGLRFHPIYHVWKLHSGQDIAEACGLPIYAAHAGTVVYAGWYSDLGNFVEIDEGGGVLTGYGHIQPGGIGVHVGQHVGPGQNIARVGMTGGATGCHLHFMVYVHGSLTNPVTFMRARGVTLGS